MFYLGIFDGLYNMYYTDFYDKLCFFNHSILIIVGVVSCAHAFLLNHLSKCVIWSSLRRQNMNIQ